METVTDLFGETWMPVIGFEGAYEVSDWGRIRSLTRKVNHKNGHTYTVHGRLLRPGRHPRGYQHVILSGYQTRKLHRLVLEAFEGQCPAGQEALHKDGVPWNNKLANLRWGTRSENHTDRVLHGASNRGERQGRSKLTAADVRQIAQSPEPIQTLADRFGVTRQHVGKIKSGKTWAWMATGTPPPGPLPA